MKYSSHAYSSWKENFKRQCYKSFFITAEKQSSFNPLRLQINLRLYSVFVSCCFFTKHNIMSSGCIFLNPDSVSSPWIPWWSWILLSAFSITGDNPFISFCPFPHANIAAVSGTRRLQSNVSDIFICHQACSLTRLRGRLLTQSVLLN